MRSSLVVALGMITGSVLAAHAAAQQPSEPTQPAEAQPAAATDATEPAAATTPPESDKLQLALTPYVWLTSFSGKSGVAGVLLNVDESFYDILDKSDSVFGLMGALDIQYKKFVFQVNGTYSHAEFSESRGVAYDNGGATANVSAKLDVDSAWYEALGGYRFIDKPIGKSGESRFMLDGFLGGRVTDMSLDLKVKSDETITLPNGITLEKDKEHGLKQDEAWFEPFLGVNMWLHFDQHWALLVRGDIGGFGVDDSAFSWQALGALGYKWQLDGWSISAFGGYRALSQDYSNGGFTWDATTHGVIFGATFTFSF